MKKLLLLMLITPLIGFGQTASIEVTKTWTLENDLDNNNIVNVGDQIKFIISVKNDGNETLINIVYDDRFLDGSTPPNLLSFDPPNNPRTLTWIASDAGSFEGMLNAGETATYYAYYTVTQEVYDSGEATNTVAFFGVSEGTTVSDVSDNGNDIDGNTSDDVTRISMGVQHGNMTDIILNGSVSAENNQIKNVAEPTDDKDAVTKEYLLEKISILQDQIDYIRNRDNQRDDDGDDYTEVEGDCNDTEASIRPLVKEVADGIDNNCDGNIDEGYNYTPVIDIDGNSYNYAAYGDQVWTVKSAEMVTYRDGTTIPQVTDTTEWANLTTGAWCYYDNDPSKGKLYNWYAVAGIHDNDENTPNKELAPEGWHVPTDAEWTELENFLIANGYNYDGTTTGNKIAKSMASTIGWNSSTEQGAIGNNQSLNNSSGFNTLSTPVRGSNGIFGTVIVFWTIDNDAWYRQFSGSSSTSLGRYSTTGKSGGAQVRFVKD
ncbi:MAG: FISUMP domain-containing protein [Flavobacteriaceae bacterium]